MEVRDQQILIVGGARSGIAAAKFLAARGARVTVNDAKPEGELAAASELRAAGVGIVGGGHPFSLFENADLIVASPGVPLALEPFKRARAAGVSVIGEMELAARFISGRLVGITGSNGKTTTTALTGELLARAGLPVQVGGNIGTPLISLVEASRPDGFTVIEASSFQLEDVDQLHFFAATILNITPDHLDRYEGMDEYAAAKANIFRHQIADDTAVLNADDARVAAMQGLTPARKVFFSRARELEEGICLRGDEVVWRDGKTEQILMRRDEMGLRGAHNLENAMAALALGLACGADRESMRATIREFSGVEHRLEFVAEVRGVKFYNDSKATNVDAAIKALEAFNEKTVVILGGKDKGSDYAPLAPLVKERCSHVILIGAAGDKIGAAIAGAAPLHRSETMEEAVERGLLLAAAGEVVLLAPACASFDMFENYEHRGRVFKDAVRRLAAGASENGVKSA
jgi:UDP-N-acetylmuramoylalanine--D-glutamate ligase